MRSALKGRHEPTHIAPSGLSKSNASNQWLTPNGYNLPSLSELKSRNFTTDAAGFFAYGVRKSAAD